MLLKIVFSDYYEFVYLAKTVIYQFKCFRSLNNDMNQLSNNHLLLRTVVYYSLMQQMVQKGWWQKCKTSKTQTKLVSMDVKAINSHIEGEKMCKSRN